MPGPGAYWIGEEEKKELLDVIESGHINRYGERTDPRYKQKVLTLEKEFAAFCGVKHCVATSSGTSTLLVALKTLGIQPGDEVIIPTYTFIASYGAAIFLGAIPVLAEINESLCLDPNDIERRITAKTKAIMPVHILGNSCDMDAIMEIAQKKGLPIIEDCCQACGASYRGKKVGTMGELGGYSLNIFKTITAGDGGMLITNNDRHFEYAFSMTDQGYKKKDSLLEIAPPSILGLNFRMNELTGAVALAQLRKLDTITSTLREKKKRFKERIAGTKGIRFRVLNDPDGECGTVLTVIFDSQEKAAQVGQKLGTVTVDQTGWHVYSNMDQIVRFLQERGYPHSASDFPRTDDLLKRSINISIGVVDAGLGTAFGINIDSTDDEIDRAAACFVQACETA